jgi:hypothetical protein
MNPTSAITGLLAQAQVSESVPDPWAESFLGFGSEQRFVLVIVALGCITGVIITLACLISSAISSVHQRRLEIELKREMLDRGMSADEVAKVIETTVPDQTTNYLNAMFGRKK